MDRLKRNKRQINLELKTHIEYLESKLSQISKKIRGTLINNIEERKQSTTRNKEKMKRERFESHKTKKKQQKQGSRFGHWAS